MYESRSLDLSAPTFGVWRPGKAADWLVATVATPTDVQFG